MDQIKKEEKFSECLICGCAYYVEDGKNHCMFHPSPGSEKVEMGKTTDIELAALTFLVQMQRKRDAEKGDKRVLERTINDL